ncbi:MAG: alpha/beta hydrolase [Dehalococcoidia bacterium]
MKLELVSVPTPTHPLDGAYYTPDGPAKGGALYLHGNQMNFYVCAARFLPPYLTALGYAFLAFNRRGHDTVSTRDSREPEGGAFQTVTEGVEDNELAARFLTQRGFDAPIVIGHSNGGMLAGHFAAHHPETKALILLSAHGGGKQWAQRASSRGAFAADRLQELKQKAQELVASGRPRQLLLLTGWWHVISAQTLLDYSANVPDLLQDARSVQCPVLFIRGDKEPAENYPAEAFQEVCPSPCEVVIVEDSDHFYTGAEERVANIVCNWLAKTLG